jgi:hypothetical protein
MKTPAWLTRDLGPRGIILVIVFTELMYCFTYHQDRWNTVLNRRELPPEHEGEGLVIQQNGLGHYAWLRSLLIDHDWNFDNEFDDHKPLGEYMPPPTYRTAIGRRANQWSVGPACLWAITVVPGHLVLKALRGSLGPWALDGYSLPYQLLVGGTSLSLAIVGLGFLYGICRTQARTCRAAFATALLVLGSPIVYYSAIEISLAHGLGTTALAALVWCWLKSYGSVNAGRWFLIGVLVGAAALMRWQLAVYALLPAMELLATKRFRDFRKATWLTISALGGAILAFLPQVFAWHAVYGAWLVNPIQGVTYHWLNPSFWTLLCSQDRSLFYWSPVTLMASLGTACFLISKNTPLPPRGNSYFDLDRTPFWILAIAFLVQVYALAGIWGQGPRLALTGNYGGVFLARSFGLRDLTESLVVLGPGLAWALEKTEGWIFRSLAAGGIVLVAWNLLLMTLYTNGLIPEHAGASPTVLLTGARQLFETDLQAFTQSLEAPLLLSVILALAPRERPF